MLRHELWGYPLYQWLFIVWGVGFLLFFCLLALLYYNRRALRARPRKKRPESKFIHVDGVEIHYEISGSGPAMLLLHGIGASTFAWRFIVSKLAESHTVIAVDIPGFGLSAKPTNRSYDLDSQTDILHRFLLKLGFQQAVLVGSSMGGLIALWMARRWPESFINVISISPPLNSNLLPFDVSRLHRIARPARMVLNEHIIRTILKRVSGDPKNISKDAVRSYTQPYLDSGESIQTFLLATKTVMDKRIPEDLKEIKSRVLLLWGEKDKIVPVRSARIGLDVIPNAFFSSHPEAGHHPMEDKPDWVVNEIKTFLQDEDEI